MTQENHENIAKQFVIDTLKLKELPKGSLQDILKDGILLCDLISHFSPKERIIKNGSRSKFAYQDNIGQFLREAENYIPQSDLFQTVDLLEGKRMQSVISCLLAIERHMRDKQITSSKRSREFSTPGRKGAYSPPTCISSHIPEPKPTYKRHFPPKEGYVRARVQMMSSNHHLSVEPTPKTRRFSSSDNKLQQDATKNLPAPTPSKSTPLTVPKLSMDIQQEKKSDSDLENNQKQIKYYQSMEQANRKTSLKKMGTYAINVKNEDGTAFDYALGKSIGKGQFGEVFGGLNMDTGEYVAIKRIKINQMNCDDMKEVSVLQDLDSEYIVRYKGFSKDREYLNIILEYVEMGSLFNNIRAFGKFPEKLAASYTFKILSGLHYLHSKDVVHCDLKAANILTTKTGGLKLTDFGVSLSLKMKEDEDTGEPAGTPNWMAPEVIKFAGASDKADVWSLGCTIVEMLTGKPPYADLPSFTALYRIVEDDEPPIPKKIKLSEEATEFLLACFRKNPKDRPSAYDLMHFKWMAPFFSKSSLQTPDQAALKKSKSETSLESRNQHTFIDSQTVQRGETCSACSYRFKDNWVKQCQDCQLNFHHHCINKVDKCQKYAKKKYSTTKEKANTPLGPLPAFDATNRKSYVTLTERSEKYYETNRRNKSSISV